MNDLKQSLTRRGFLNKAGVAGLGIAGMGLLSGKAEAAGPSQNGLIVEAATYAEALASTMYYNIIATTGGIYQKGLSGNLNDQAYLVAGLEQEVEHYAVLRALGGPDLTGMKFYFPTGMFTDPATTVNTLTTLEDAFIAAYIIGVRDFSSSTFRVYAAQILGVECEHRAFARVVAADLTLGATTGLTGMSEPTDGPANAANNLAYERPFLPNISAAFTALTPFITPPAAGSGFSATPYTLPAITLNGNGTGFVTLPTGIAKVALTDTLPGTPGTPDATSN